MRDLGKAGKSPPEEAQAVREYLEQFSSVPLLNGKRAYGIMPSGQVTLAVSHSLGRAYAGAFQITSGLPGVVLTVYSATVASDAGLDPARYVLVLAASAPGANCGFELWVW